MRPPDFFVVGGPRCGTTALFTYLRSHPDIFLPPVKDIHFFGSDLPYGYRMTRTEAQYRSYFRRGVAGEAIRAGAAACVGEVSGWYLYSRLAASEIQAYAPSARIIIMLRNPADMMYSLFAANQAVGAEDLTDFRAALEAEPARAQGIGVPEHPGMAESVLYRRIASCAEQVERYLSRFGPERVHVILFDDLARDAGGVYRETLRFLGMRDDGRREFAAVNEFHRSRSRLITRLLKRPPRRLLAVGEAVLPPLWPRRAAEWLRRLNARRASRPPMEPDLRRRLSEEFAPEVERLGALIGRDLSSWSRA